MTLMARRRALMAESSGESVIDGSKLVWEQGLIDGTTGINDGTKSTYISTSSYINANPGKTVFYTGPKKDANDVVWSVLVLQYANDYSFISRQYLTSTTGVYITPKLNSNCKYIKFSFGHVEASGVNVDPVDGENFFAKIDNNDQKLIAGLYNKPVTAGDYVSMLVNPYPSGMASTILLDIQAGNTTSSGAASSLYKLLNVYSEGQNYLAVGKAARTATQISVWWISTSASNKTDITVDGVASPAYTGRKKIAITHEADSGTITMYYAINGSTMQSTTFTKTFKPSVANLNIGASGSTGALPSGTIYKAEVYSRVLTDDEINAFFS